MKKKIDPSRIPAGMDPNSDEYKKLVEMLLPDGHSCSQCYHHLRCTGFLGQKSTDTKCQFFPSKFSYRPGLHQIIINASDKTMSCTICKTVKILPPGPLYLADFREALDNFCKHHINCIPQEKE